MSADCEHVWLSMRQVDGKDYQVCAVNGCKQTVDLPDTSP